MRCMQQLHLKRYILLWCDGRTQNEDEGSVSNKTKRRKTSDGCLTKREEQEKEIDILATELKEQHKSKCELDDVQYRLWARCIVVGIHSSRDVPPTLPLFTGSTSRKQKSTEAKVALQETIVSTAAAVVKAMGGNLPVIQSPNINQTIQDSSHIAAPITSTQRDLGVSPGKAAAKNYNNTTK